MKKQRTFTVYVSGKISNLPEDVYKANFKSAELELRKRGFNVINPAETDIKRRKNMTDEQFWVECMLTDIRDIMETCDGIYMLNNWRSSRGARIERIIAQEIGLFIAYQSK